MAKRASLTMPAPAAAPQPAPTPAPAAAPGRVKSRAGKVGVSFWVDPDVHLQLRRLSVDSRKPIQTLMEEALDLLFRRHGRAGIASPPA